MNRTERLYSSRLIAKSKDIKQPGALQGNSGGGLVLAAGLPASALVLLVDADRSVDRLIHFTRGFLQLFIPAHRGGWYPQDLGRLEHTRRTFRGGGTNEEVVLWLGREALSSLYEKE